MSSNIREFVTSLEVPYLLHFTRAENIGSIMHHGLVPVGLVAEKGIIAVTNDAYRFDGQRGANSLSIGFPNHRMFYKYRQEDESADWAILMIAPSVLWKKRCAFCQRNAADSLMTAIPIEERMTFAALSGMFHEIEGERSRAEQKLKPSDPTHDQAEVLVFDVIEPSLIQGAAFNSLAAKTKYGPLLEPRPILRQGKRSGFFGTRSYSREY